MLRGSTRIPLLSGRPCSLPHALSPLPSLAARLFSSTPRRPADKPPSADDWRAQLSALSSKPTSTPGSPAPPPPPRVPGTPYTTPSTTPKTSRFLYDASKTGGGNIDLASIISDATDDFIKERLPGGRSKTVISHKPSTGRTVFVRKSLNLTVALKLLGRIIKDNQLRKLQRLQRFHERPGLKRKRLASERWKTRFKKGFKAACQRVQELNRQGW